MKGHGILLCDDSVEDCELLSRAFEDVKFEHNVTVVHDGQEALEYLFAQGAHRGRDRALTPLLTILDLKMPRVGGLEVLRRVRGDSLLKYLAVMILTSSSEDRDRTEALRLGVGANLYYSKPFNFDGYLEMAEQIKRLTSYAESQ